MKIKYQLWLIFSGLFILVSFTVYMFVSESYERRLQQGYELISITQGSAVLDNLKDTYPFTPNRSIGYLETFSEELNMRLIMLDQDKKVYADSFQELKSNATLNLDILNLDDLPGSLFVETASSAYVQYTLIPFQSGERKGYLLMVEEAEQLFRELKSFQKWMVQILAISLFVFFLISYFVSSWFSKPIRQIIFNLTKITPLKRTFYLKYQRRDEIKELIVAIKNMVEELNRYDERQRRFLSTSSHELKTPLATIQLILENLPYVRENEERYREFVRDLSFQVQKMKIMVEQLLEINRIWDRQLQKEILKAEEIKEYLLQSFQHIARDKNIFLEFELETVDLFVDQYLFLRGLDNIVFNAIRYSSEGRSVRIMMKNIRDKNENKISVCDQGIGIKPEDLPHVLEPFYRSNDASAWNQEGSGLGLTIVKQMVEMHQGRIDIKTGEHGTCIHLFFPKT
ncbi:MAG: HAMP domain-containing sensor histidine kinase [Desulfitobacteriaceae bacterium]|nr:HAMP domain-containing sensor histidine kinase [Desulfitobacteriaceae bacterium]